METTSFNLPNNKSPHAFLCSLNCAVNTCKIGAHDFATVIIHVTLRRHSAECLSALQGAKQRLKR